VADARSLALSPPGGGIADLLAEHPWPSEYAHARRLEWLWSFDVPATADRLWPVIADLSRINRALGLPVMRFEERDGLRWGQARYTGVPHEWVEHPWNWVAGRWYEVVRRYQRGAMRALFAVYHLEPRGAETRLHVYYGIVPRSRLLDLPLRWSFGAMGRAYRRLLPRAAEEAMRAPTVPASLRAPPPALRAEAAGRLTRLGEDLLGAGLDAAAVRHLIEWVETADDAELERIRVRERARAWQLDEDVLLRVCLHATRAGLLELTWDVVCPHCRGVRAATPNLGALPTRGSCAACGIEFGTDAAEAVEITFHAHSSIRPVARTAYCSAEPSHKPHILAQRTVAAGASAALTLPEAPGRYRLRLRGAMAAAGLEIAAGGSGTVIWHSRALPEASPAAPGARLQLVNDGEAEATFVVETAAWLDLALRPGKLLSFQDFRDLFSEEYLGADVQLAVGEQTILFTDVVGSTAMYAERGDPEAFVEVKRHFEELFRIVGEHRGAVVKTIGDAAMGAFNDPLDALRAARAIHAAFRPERGPIRLRVSINTGPCIAVRLNANIDYFGHAVNLAAKLQAAAGAGQVALSAATHAAPGVAAWLAAEGIALDELPLEVKGIGEPVRVLRWSAG
jgi:class 3 adenylate cyclase